MLAPLLDSNIRTPNWRQKTWYRLRKQALHEPAAEMIRWMLEQEAKRLWRLLKRMGQPAIGWMLRLQKDKLGALTGLLDEQGLPVNWGLIHRLYAKAMRDYRPRRLDSQGILFRADPDDEEFARAVDDSLGWANLFSEGLEIIPMVADHHAMIQQPPTI